MTRAKRGRIGQIRNRRLGAVLGALVLMASAVALAEPPEPMPAPTRKPDALADPADVAEQAPAPSRKPDGVGDTLPTSADGDQAAADAIETHPDALPVPFGGSDVMAACLSALDTLEAQVAAVDPIETDEGCLIDDPVRLSTVGVNGGALSLSAKPTLRCGFAVTFARWLAHVLSPLAEHHLGSPIARVLVGPGYVCRFRNNARGGKLSEHAFGNAIDILGFEPARGDPLLVVSYPEAPAPARAFLDAARTTACGYFTTVLGPGADDSHHDHFHLDLGRHGRSGSYRICE